MLITFPHIVGGMLMGAGYSKSNRLACPLYFHIGAQEDEGQ